MRTSAHAHGAPDTATGIDLAPMLDFVVNLLIFFIVTAVFVKQAGVEVRRPAAIDDGTAKPSKSIWRRSSSLSSSCARILLRIASLNQSINQSINQLTDHQAPTT